MLENIFIIIISGQIYLSINGSSKPSAGKAIELSKETFLNCMSHMNGEPIHGTILSLRK